MRRGILLVISGPSGVGKTTLIERLLSEFPSITRSISCTTRPIRENEVDGKDYHFITPTTFNELKDKGMLLEWAEIHGHLYGTPISDKHIDDLISHGKDVLFLS